MKLDSPDETLAQAICIRRELCVVDRRVEGSMGCYEKQSLQGVLETPDGTRLAAQETIGETLRTASQILTTRWIHKCWTDPIRMVWTRMPTTKRTFDHISLNT